MDVVARPWKGKWRCRHNINSKRFYKVFPKDFTQEEANAAAQKWADSIGKKIRHRTVKKVEYVGTIDDVWRNYRVYRLSANIKQRSKDAYEWPLMRIGKIIAGSPLPKPSNLVGWCTLFGKIRAGILASKFAPSSKNDLIKMLSNFINWTYTSYLLDALPRDMKNLTALVEVQLNPQVIPLGDLAKIWKAAPDRQKAHMILALNFAFLMEDVKTLDPKSVNWKTGRIVSIRGKTQNPYNFLAHPLTLRWMKWRRDDEVGVKVHKSPYLFHGRDGESMNPTVAAHFWRRICERAGISYGFSQIRKTSATLMRHRINASLSKQLLRHMIPGAERHYIADEPSPLLDEAMRRMMDEFYVPFLTEPPGK